MNELHPVAAARTIGEKRSGRQALDGYLSFWRYSRRAIALVWSTHRGADDRRSALLTLAAGLMPAGVAYLGKLIVDAVVAALDANRAGDAPDYAQRALARRASKGCSSRRWPACSAASTSASRCCACCCRSACIS